MNRERNFVEFWDPNTGRIWTANAVDEFIVGKVHGRYDMKTILRYITYTYTSLTSMDLEELQEFWDETLMTSTKLHYAHWATTPRDDPKVQKVLNRVSTLLAEANCVMD